MPQRAPNVRRPASDQVNSAPSEATSGPLESLVNVMLSCQTSSLH
jgi:hypothetical protein